MTACNGSLGMGILMMLWNCSSKIDSEDDHKLIAYSSSCTLPGQEHQKLKNCLSFSNQRVMFHRTMT